MTPRALLELAHHHPGRLRVRSDALCESANAQDAGARLDLVRSTLSAMVGVRSVGFNPRSGSVLVEYEPGAVDPNALIDAVAVTAGLELPDDEVRAQRMHPARAAIGAARGLNALTRELTGGRADLRTLVPIAMSGLAAYSFIVGKDRMPRWDSLAYWAFSIFQTLHASEIADREDHTS